MPLKPCFLFLFSILFLTTAFAQKQNVYFLKNNDKKVSTRDSADYIRIIQEPDSGSVAYNLTEYYTNGKLKRISKTLAIEKLKLDGPCITYFKSGKKQAFANYNKGSLIGDMVDYFPNGVVCTVKSYNKQTSDFYIKTSNDSLGKPMVVDGNGYYVTYTSDLKAISTEGNLKNGVKNGEWKKYNCTPDSLNIIEMYKDGKLIRGESIDKKGKTYSYADHDEVPPAYNGGAEGLSAFLRTHMIYPANARANNIQGRVFVTFIVNRDGSLTDVKITKTPDSDLGEEALRVLKQSPKWIPGYQYGRPVRVQYTIPINFSLGL